MHESLTHVSSASAHGGPHILPTKGEPIVGWFLWDFPITNTIFSTWLFMVFLFLMVSVFYIAVKTERFPRIRAIGIDIMHRLYTYTHSLLGNAGTTHRYMWLLWGIFIAVFVGNIFWLVLDWINIFIPSMHTYLRPLYSDLATTLVLSLTVIGIAQVSSLIRQWPKHYLAHYLWNYQGESSAEKIVNVFVGWLHFFGEFIRIGSLSMRLFLNILVGAILISIAVYIGKMIPSFHTGAFQIVSLPFWFFELLVAFLQAYIFMTLSSLYIREALPERVQHHTVSRES